MNHQTISIKLTTEQKSALSWLLTMNARRDLTKEHDAYQRLSEDRSFTDELRIKYRSNAEFCAKKLAQIDELDNILRRA